MPTEYPNSPNPHLGPRNPILDNYQFLVHGECPCGFRMAAPEGSLWPICPNCGEEVRPPLPPRGADGDLKPELSDRKGYAALFLPEAEALQKVKELNERKRSDVPYA